MANDRKRCIRATCHSLDADDLEHAIVHEASLDTLLHFPRSQQQSPGRSIQPPHLPPQNLRPLINFNRQALRATLRCRQWVMLKDDIRVSSNVPGIIPFAPVVYMCLRLYDTLQHRELKGESALERLKHEGLEKECSRLPPWSLAD